LASGIEVEVFEKMGVKLAPATAGKAGTTSTIGCSGARAFEYSYGFVGEGHCSLVDLRRFRMEARRPILLERSKKE